MAAPAPLSPADVPSRLTAGLDADQRRAVTALNGPVLVIAGPGSGKTRVLTRRVAAVHSAGIPAGRICAVTFTNKAAAEMRDRIAGLSGDDAAEAMTVSTFHALCARILRRWHAALGLPQGFTIVDPSDTARMMRDAARALGLDANATPTQVSDMCADAAAAIAAAKNDGHATWKTAGLDPRTSQLWSGTAARMKEAGCVDFDDLLTHTWALRAAPDARAWLAGLFDRVHVDEYQDTNPVQQRIVGLLAPTGEVCAVGDPDQSIYAFRGATGAVADLFTSTYPDHQVVVLGANYRSTAAVCAISSAVIAANPAAHRSGMRPTGAAGGRTEVIVAADEDDEADAVAAQVAGATGSRAVLVRANQQTRALERALTAAGVPHTLVGTVRFTDRAEVKDVLAWVRLAANPHDVEAFRRAAQVPRRGLGPATVDRVVAHAKAEDVGLVDACRALATSTAGRASAPLGSFAADMSSVRAAARTGSAVSLVAAIVDGAGVRAAIAGAPGERSAERGANIDEVAVAARQVDEALAGRAGDGFVDPAAALCQHLSLASASDASAGAGRVVVSTIHAAKGKEFDHVWVVGCEEGVLPHVKSVPAGVAEERRLMFVACSRARATLTLSRAVSRWTPGAGRADNRPSRFLADIPAHLLRVSPTAAATADPRRPTNAAPGPVRARPAAPSAVFNVGDRARHAKFGPATVVEVAATTVKVRFDGDGAERVFMSDGVHLRPA